FALLISSALAHRLSAILVVFVFALSLATLSRISWLGLAKRGWAPALFFSGAIALPAVFITPGRVLYRLPALDWPVTAPGGSRAGKRRLRSRCCSSCPRPGRGS